MKVISESGTIKKDLYTEQVHKSDYLKDTTVEKREWEPSPLLESEGLKISNTTSNLTWQNHRALGYQALVAPSSGIYNVAIGSSAMASVPQRRQPTASDYSPQGSTELRHNRVIPRFINGNICCQCERQMALIYKNEIYFCDLCQKWCTPEDTRIMLSSTLDKKLEMINSQTRAMNGTKYNYYY